MKQRSKSAARTISSKFEVTRPRQHSELTTHTQNKSMSALKKFQSVVKKINNIQLNQDSNADLQKSRTEKNVLKIRRKDNGENFAKVVNNIKLLNEQRRA